MLWIFHCLGSFSWKAMKDMTCVILKGLVYLMESFMEGTITDPWDLLLFPPFHPLHYSNPYGT